MTTPTHPTEAAKAAERIYQVRAEALDRENAVVHHPDQFAGFHVGWVEPYKPGVFRYFATRQCKGEIEARNGFVRCDVLRVAIETGVIAKPNGYTLP